MQMFLTPSQKNYLKTIKTKKQQCKNIRENNRNTLKSHEKIRH